MKKLWLFVLLVGIFVIGFVVSEVEASEWQDMEGNVITEANVGDTVRMVSGEVGDDGSEVYEYDEEGYAVGEEDWLDDDDIRVGDDAIGGLVEDGEYVAHWEITFEDFAKGSENIGDGDVTEFYFTVGEDKSGELNVRGVRNDSAMEVSLDSPVSGEDYNVSDDVLINISARDEDDYINGTVSINGVEENNFSNGGKAFNYTFDSPGNFQIVIDAVNSRGKKVQDSANVIVLDVDVSGNYVDGVFLAAALSSPEDFSNINDSFVHFDASTTKAIMVEGGVKSEFTPMSDPERFSWYWRFMPGDIVYEFVNSDDPLAYNFSVEFSVAGGNSASLRVEFDEFV